MAHYAVYVECDEAGPCLAHVLDLPGCAVRAGSLITAMEALPDEIRAYLAWRRAHGEELPGTDTPPTLAIAETHPGGPYTRGSAAALFAPDRVAVSRDDLDRHLRLAGDTRADLLSVVRDLPGEVLDWSPAAPGTQAAEELSIRAILRHVGNAEEWYVSRLVAAETLPPEWEHDTGLPIFEFLEMERRTALARLHALSGTELAVTVRPHSERHPEELWTARKALRRLLEHEREHTLHVRAVLAAWRLELLATMARERAALLSEMLDLDPGTLSEAPVAGDWTCKDLLAHVAAWDEFVTERIERVLAGHAAEIAGIETWERNAELYPERKAWTLERALAAAVDARRALLAALARVSDEELHRTRRFSWGEASIRHWVEWRYKHDAEHRLELAAWREALNPAEGVSPRPLLLTALRASRDELLALAARVPVSEREARPLAGEWTLKDICGHLADWETQCTHAIADMLAGRSPEVAFVDDEEIWNRAQAEARRAQPWESVWRDLHAARAELLAVIEAATLEDLRRIIPSYWTDNDSAYAWARFCVKHERAHSEYL